jgi:acyl dehydratase
VSRFYEDIEPGQKIELGSHKFTRQEIIDFAERFDPQPFHLDEEAAKTSLFGALCASGWHTACVWMRLMTEHEQRLREELITSGQPAFGFGVSPGFRDLTWPTPVYVDDVITYSIKYLEKRPLKSRPGWGILLHYDEGINQRDETVMRMTANLFVARRES